MRMTDLLACPPALHNRIRAEHSVIRDITHAALAKGATIALRDEEDTFGRVEDWYALKERLHDTESQTLCFTFPERTFSPTSLKVRLYLSLVFGNDGPDVVCDWQANGQQERDLEDRPLLAEILADALLFGERICRHVTVPLAAWGARPRPHG